MKHRLFITNIVSAVALLAAAAWAVDNPSIQNPSVNSSVGMGGTPQSSISSGLTGSPNPMGLNGNLIVTGNVSGGKHFRGVVPYNAVSDFGGRLGSGSVDSFLRYSADGSYSSTLTPYYSPTRTVSILTPGSQGQLLAPSYVNLSGGSGLGPLPNQQFAPTSTSYMTNSQFRPLSTNLQGLNRTLSQDIAAYPQGGIQTAQQQQAQMDRYREELKQQAEKTAQDQQNIADQKESSEQDAKNKKKLGENKPGDSFENIQKELETVQKILDQLKAGETPTLPDNSDKQTEAENAAKQETADRDAAASNLSAKAKTVLGEHKTFKDFEKAKYNEHIRTAENYMKQGRYYLAADSYSMALVYKPSDLTALTGKCHALFAAGEYMSSALFLSRALEISPEFVNSKVDLVAVIGNKDTIETRASDILKWMKITNSPELGFLLGYIYYRLDRPDFSKAMIDAAAEKMPDSPAVETLKKAIYDRAANK
jgi:tetratricopeptide (TPR) repeat protein